MAGDRGSHSNAFTLFLIFLLLYLSQKGTSASAYSENSKIKEDQPKYPDQPLEEKVAVSLSNGEAVDFNQNTYVANEPDITDEMEEPYADDVEQTDSNVEYDQEVWQEQPEAFQPDNEATEDMDETVELGENTFIEEDQQIPEVPVEESFQEIQEIEVPVEGSPKELPELAYEVPETESYEEEVKNTESPQELLDSEVTEEPVLGGQSNLFLKPTVMNSKSQQKNGPKISFKFSS